MIFFNRTQFWNSPPTVCVLARKVFFFSFFSPLLFLTGNKKVVFFFNAAQIIKFKHSWGNFIKISFWNLTSSLYNVTIMTLLRYKFNFLFVFRDVFHLSSHLRAVYVLLGQFRPSPFPGSCFRLAVQNILFHFPTVASRLSLPPHSSASLHPGLISVWEGRALAGALQKWEGKWRKGGGGTEVLRNSRTSENLLRVSAGGDTHAGGPKKKKKVNRRSIERVKKVKETWEADTHSCIYSILLQQYCSILKSLW